MARYRNATVLDHRGYRSHTIGIAGVAAGLVEVEGEGTFNARLTGQTARPENTPIVDLYDGADVIRVVWPANLEPPAA